MMCESINEIILTWHVCTCPGHFAVKLFTFYFQNAAVIPCLETLPAPNLTLDSQWS